MQRHNIGICLAFTMAATSMAPLLIQQDMSPQAAEQVNVEEVVPPATLAKKLFQIRLEQAFRAHPEYYVAMRTVKNYPATQAYWKSKLDAPSQQALQTFVKKGFDAGANALGFGSATGVFKTAAETIEILPEGKQSEFGALLENTSAVVGRQQIASDPDGFQEYTAAFTEDYYKPGAKRTAEEAVQVEFFKESVQKPLGLPTPVRDPAKLLADDPHAGDTMAQLGVKFGIDIDDYRCLESSKCTMSEVAAKNGMTAAELKQRATDVMTTEAQTLQQSMTDKVSAGFPVEADEAAVDEVPQNGEQPDDQENVVTTERRLAEIKQYAADARGFAGSARALAAIFSIGSPDLQKTITGVEAAIDIGEAVASMIAEGAMSPSGVATVLGGIATMKGLLSKGTPSPEVSMLQEVLRNQKIMIEKLVSIEHKIDVLDAKIDAIENQITLILDFLVAQGNHIDDQFLALAAKMDAKFEYQATLDMQIGRENIINSMESDWNNVMSWPQNAHEEYVACIRNAKACKEGDIDRINGMFGLAGSIAAATGTLGSTVAFIRSHEFPVHGPSELTAAANIGPDELKKVVGDQSEVQHAVQDDPENLVGDIPAMGVWLNEFRKLHPDLRPVDIWALTGGLAPGVNFGGPEAIVAYPHPYYFTEKTLPWFVELVEALPAERATQMASGHSAQIVTAGLAGVEQAAVEMQQSAPTALDAYKHSLEPLDRLLDAFLETDNLVTRNYISLEEYEKISGLLQIIKSTPTSAYLPFKYEPAFNEFFYSHYFNTRDLGEREIAFTEAFSALPAFETYFFKGDADEEKMVSHFKGLPDKDLVDILEKLGVVRKRTYTTESPLTYQTDAIKCAHPELLKHPRQNDADHMEQLFRIAGCENYVMIEAGIEVTGNFGLVGLPLRFWQTNSGPKVKGEQLAEPVEQKLSDEIRTRLIGLIVDYTLDARQQLFAKWDRLRSGQYPSILDLNTTRVNVRHAASASAALLKGGFGTCFEQMDTFKDLSSFVKELPNIDGKLAALSTATDLPSLWRAANAVKNLTEKVPAVPDVVIAPGTCSLGWGNLPGAHDAIDRLQRLAMPRPAV